MGKAYANRKLEAERSPNEEYDIKSVYINFNGEDFYRYPEYPDRIAVSKTGKVFSISSQKLYKTNINPVSGYEMLMLMIQKPKRHTKTLYVHRIVAKTFIDNPLNKREVNHIDGNRINNSLENLEWVTGSENMLHSYRVLNRSPHLEGINKTREKQKFFTKEQVEFIKRNNNMSALKLCKLLGLPSSKESIVRNVKSGRSYREYNFLLGVCDGK